MNQIRSKDLLVALYPLCSQKYISRIPGPLKASWVNSFARRNEYCAPSFIRLVTTILNPDKQLIPQPNFHVRSPKRLVRWRCGEQTVKRMNHSILFQYCAGASFKQASIQVKYSTFTPRLLLRNLANKSQYSLWPTAPSQPPHLKHSH